MKFKEIDRTASVAWSPAALDNVYLAAGTAAQQLDSSFSTNAVLELYQLNVNEPGLDVPIKATYTSENRFHKLVWGCHGIGGEQNEYPSGIIVGGCDGGVMQVFNANKLFQNEDPIVLTKNKHIGPVRALDFNCFRSNLIASGATESEIFIWDLNNAKVPMSPGAKIQPSDDVTDLEWNKQVEHILASTFPARCVVWDLRKNEPVIKVSDSTSRIRYKCVRWHPEVATQMCLASEDDASPVIQLWDLRYATSPLKVIQGHQRGILGMSWCAQDPELLLTCGKDSRILCWNPNYPHAGYEMVLDIPTASQWSFDVSFCPKNPIILSSCTFDGRISLYGLSGGAQQPVTSSKLADSFPGMDMSISNAPVPSQQTTSQQIRDPPKWYKRPAGVSFAFGGRLVSFQNIKTPSNQPGVPDRVTGTVNISQVVTLPSFIERSRKLEEALQTGSLEFYCSEKAIIATDPEEKHIWEFLQASFSQDPRRAYVSLLGYNTAEMLTNLNQILHEKDMASMIHTLNDAVGPISEKESDSGLAQAYQNGIDELKPVENVPQFSIPTNEDSVDGRINQAIICGSIEVAVKLCLDNERWADALLLATRGPPELMTLVQDKYFKKCSTSTNMIKAIVRNDLHHLVSNCELESWKQALATALTYADNAEFQTITETLGQRLLESKDDNLTQGALLCFICSGSLNQLVDAWLGSSGKGSSPDELQDLVEQVMILKKAAEMWGRDANIGGGSLAGKMVEYASTLASQGCLDTALSYLKDSNDPSINALRERLQLSLGYGPTRSQVASRSRQTSESSGYRSMQKRPSHPSAPVKRSSDVYQPNDFSNLTGPVHPPAAPSYSSTSVLNSGYGAPSQYSPGPPPPTNTGLLTYAQGPVSGGLPPKPPSVAPMSGPPPTMFNPAEAAAEMNSSKNHEPIARKISSGSLPRPPVSNVASGWNDPPPIVAKSKTTSQASSQQMITHPIFGSAPEPVSMPAPGMGNPPGSYGAPVPPPPTASSRPYGNVTPPSAAPQPYGASTMQPPPAVGVRPYGSTPPPMGGSMFSPAPPPSGPYGSSNTGMSQVSGPPTYGGAPAPISAQPYGGVSVPPPPTASTQAYGGTPAPPPSAATQPYGGAGVPPPPTAVSQPYGGAGNAPPPMSGAKPFTPSIPPPVAPFNPVPPPSGLPPPSQSYGSGTVPPPPSIGGPPPSTFSPAPVGTAFPPLSTNQSFGQPPPSGMSSAMYNQAGSGYGGPGPANTVLPPPPTAAMQPYMSAPPPVSGSF